MPVKKPDKKRKLSGGPNKEDRIIVLLEDMRGEIKLVAEGHSILNRKIDNLSFKVDNLETKVDSLEVKVDGLELRMDRMETKMDEGFRLVLDHLDGLDREFMELKNDLKNNYERKGHDAVWRKAIEKRVEKLEKIFLAQKASRT